MYYIKSQPRPALDRTAVPSAAQLASLGVVLCLHRRGSALLDGWHAAKDARPCHDQSNPREHLCFHDGDSRCRWQLHLLPETDFLAWDALMSTLPVGMRPAAEASGGHRLRHLLWRCGLGSRWIMRAVRFHHLPERGELAFTEEPVAWVSSGWARAVGRMQGAQGRIWRKAPSRPFLSQR